MQHFKQHFSIKDLEHLSGVKAHTIRIWEKRYNILEPNRTKTNIRLYDSDNLQKLLNISFLNENGYKISRISKMEEQDIGVLVKKISASSSEKNRATNALKVAMLNFDEQLFQETYEKLEESKSFQEIFYDIFLPFLEEIGMLWQTGTIKPIHEHYIVELIKQKIYIKISELKFKKRAWDTKLFVLFLPNNEIHDIGILYLNYELLAAGKNAIYLGPSLPMDNLKNLIEIHEEVSFLSYLTVTPSEVDVMGFIEEFQHKICKDKLRDLHLFGNRVKAIDQNALPKNVHIYQSISNFTKKL